LFWEILIVFSIKWLIDIPIDGFFLSRSSIYPTKYWMLL
jgi:hypothetical protein